MREYSKDLSECPKDVLVWVICDNYKRYAVAKLCSCCGIWSDENGQQIARVDEWAPYLTPAEERKHEKLDKIISAWLDENYEQKHKINSIRKHLNVDNISDCQNLEQKQRYLRYLRGKGDTHENT